MLSTRGDNIYIPKLRSDALGERDGARLRALRRAEARHRDADYIFFRQGEKVKSLVRNKQSKSRIKSARDADDCLFKPDMLDSLR